VEISAHHPKKPARRILIVDDEMLIRWSMAETLTHAGYEVSEASDAKETLQCIDNLPPFDVVLLDYRLPDSQELQLLEAIRRLAPRSAVVMMTAYGSPDIVRRATELGAFRVLNKPVELRDLAALVEAAFQSRPL
jgi:DNA-binding NtrC family response regulator